MSTSASAGADYVLPHPSCVPAIILLAVLPSITSCAFSQRVSDDAVDYNIAVETAQNRLLLLNAVRASKRNPMYFTGLSQIRGNLRGSIDSELEFPFGGAADNAYTATTSGSFTSNPTFDVAVLDSEKFMRGILRPASFELFNYYWQQGWPPDLIMHLFVRSLSIAGEDYDNGPTRVIDEPSKTKGAKYSTYVAAFLSKGGRPFSRPLQDEVIATWPGDAQLDLGDLVTAVAAKGLKIGVGPTGQYVLVSRKLDEGLEFDMEPGRKGLFSLAPDPEAQETAPIPDQDQAPERGILTLRSPEAMLYYLGEIIRASANGLPVPTVKLDTNYDGIAEDVPLFVARKRIGNEDAIVSVVYQGEEYIIPEEGRGRSMHCLSLIEQLLSLQKSSDELPRTAAVSLVGN